MAIFEKIRRAFGFDDPDYDPEYDNPGIDARVTPLNQRQATAQTQKQNNGMSAANQQNNAQAKDLVDNEPALAPKKIFEAAVKVFNDSLPDFLKQSIDPEKQQQYLYDALESGMKEYLVSLEYQAENRCNDRWAGQRQELQLQIDNLRQQARHSEDELSEARKQHLSAERQKRALGERVRDLEQQLATCQAEMEQGELEVKALVNKLRLAQMGMPEGADGNADETLLRELEVQKERVSNAEQQLTALQSQLQTDTEELEAKELQLEQLRNQLEEYRQNEAQQQAEITKLTDAIEQQHAKDALGNAMITDFNAAAAKAREEAAEVRSQMEQLRGECEAKDEELKRMQADNAKLNAELQQAMESMDVLEQMSMQLNTLEEKRKANEEYLHKQRQELANAEQQKAELEHNIELLNSTLTQRDEQIRQLNDMADSLRKTIENNLYEHSQNESALRYEIERLKAIQSGETNAAAPRRLSAEAQNNTASTLTIDAIADDLEDTDWLVSTPTRRSRGGKRKSDDQDSDFGYKEPERKHYPDNSAQMSLF